MLGEIFSKPGTLLLPSTPQALQSGLAWGEVLTNRILICVAVGIMILSILDIIRFFPHLLFCLRRSYGSENIEHSIAVTRLRNRCAFVAALPFCLMADYFGVYRDTLLCSPGQQLSALIVMALLFVYLLLRKLISLVIRPRNIGGEKYNAVRHCLWNYFILLVLNLLSSWLLYALWVCPGMFPDGYSCLSQGFSILLPSFGKHKFCPPFAMVCGQFCIFAPLNWCLPPSLLFRQCFCNRK